MIWARLAIIAWLAAAAVAASGRARVWGEGDEALWRAAHLAAPRKIRPIVNLGNAAWVRGDEREARFRYQQARIVAARDDRSPAERREGELLGRLNLILLDYHAGRYSTEETCENFRWFMTDYPDFRQARQVREALRCE